MPSDSWVNYFVFIQTSQLFHSVAYASSLTFNSKCLDAAVSVVPSTTAFATEIIVYAHVGRAADAMGSSPYHTIVLEKLYLKRTSTLGVLQAAVSHLLTYFFAFLWEGAGGGRGRSEICCNDSSSHLAVSGTKKPGDKRPKIQ